MAFFGRNKTETEAVELVLPKHVGIIMDGNGRWAKKRGLPRKAGHTEGARTFRKITRYCSEIGIKYLTVYAFSTENWKRPIEEVSGIFKLLIVYMERELEELHANNVKVNIFGDYSKLPKASIDALETALAKTKDNTGLTFNIALNYGGRDEIMRSVKKLAEAVAAGELKAEELTEKLAKTTAKRTRKKAAETEEGEAAEKPVKKTRKTAAKKAEETTEETAEKPVKKAARKTASKKETEK